LSRITCSFIIMIILLSFINISNPANAQQPAKALLIILPGADISVLRGNPLDNIIANATIYRVKTEPPCDPVYQELLLINNTWSLEKYMIMNETIISVNGKTMDPWSVLDINTTVKMWGNLSTLFINIRSIDPLKHPRTLNPYFNATTNTIPASVFTIPINGSTWWSLLNTTINVSLVNNTFRLSIEGYVKNVPFNNKTFSAENIVINIVNKTLTVANGRYNIDFRIIRYNDTHVTLFTPGTRNINGWYNNYFGVFTKPITPSIPIEILDKLEDDDIIWLVNKTMDYYYNVFQTGARYTGASLNIIHIPIFYEIHKAVELERVRKDLVQNITKTVVDGLNRLLNFTKIRFGDMNILIYIPFTYSDNASSMNIAGLTQTAPGIYRIDGELFNTLSALTTSGIEYSIVKFRESYYVLIRTPHVSINGGTAIGYGYLITYRSDNPGTSNILIDSRNVVGYITGLGIGYGVGLFKFSEAIDDLKKQINELNQNVTRLSNTVSSLNGTVNSLNRQLGDCNAKNLNITDQYNSLKKELDEARDRERMWMTFSIIGTISILIIILLLYFIGKRGLAKKPD